MELKKLTEELSTAFARLYKVHVSMVEVKLSCCNGEWEALIHHNADRGENLGDDGMSRTSTSVELALVTLGYSLLAAALQVMGEGDYSQLTPLVGALEESWPYDLDEEDTK